MRLLCFTPIVLSACLATNAPCPAGEHSIHGSCQALCERGVDCAAGERCQDGACLAASPVVLSMSAARSAQTSAFSLRGARGAAGPAGSCDPSACADRALPGIDTLSLLGLRARNPGDLGDDTAWQLDGVDVGLQTSDGLWLGALDRNTHRLATGPGLNRFYDLANTSLRDDLVAQLQVWDPQHAAVVLSRGEVAANLQLPAGASTVQSALRDFGAPQRLQSLGLGEAFVLVAAGAMGPGNAAFAVGAGVVELDVLLADGELLHSRTDLVGGLGASVESEELEDGTIVLADLSANAVDSAALADATLTRDDIAQQSLTAADFAPGAVSSPDFVVPASIGAVQVSASGDVGVGLTPAASLHLAGDLRFGSGVDIRHVGGVDPVCDPDVYWMRKWNQRICVDTTTSCASNTCTTVDGWNLSTPVCFTFRQFFGVCALPVFCFATEWTDAVCIGD